MTTIPPDLDDGFWDDVGGGGPTTRRGYTTHPWFVEERSLSLTVPCRDCNAAVGKVCTVDGVELKHFPAHNRRTNDARKAAP